MDIVFQFLSRENIKDYNAINIVGGISYYLKNTIKTQKKLLVPEKDGEYYTVIGMAIKNSGYLAVDLGFGDVKVARKEV